MQFERDMGGSLMTTGCRKYKLSVPIKLQKPVEDGRNAAFKGFCSLVRLVL